VAPKSTYTVNIKVDMKNVEDLKKVQQELTKIIALQSQLNKKAGVPFEKMAKSTRKTQIEMRKFGRGLQNASYQVQDFIVQVSGGVDPLRSFSQQAPQLLINMGALGAVVGVVAAGLPILIQALSDTNDSMADTVKLTEEVEGAIGDLGRTMNGLDLTPWINQFNAASETQREFMRETLELDILMAERARRAAAAPLSSQLSAVAGRDQSGGAPRMARAAQAQQARRSKELAETLGLSVEAYKELLPLIQEYARTQGQDNTVTAQLRSGLIDYNETLSENNEKLNSFIDSTWKAMEATNAMASAQKKLNEASTVGPGGKLTGGTPEKESRTRSKAVSDSLREIQAAYDQLYPSVNKYWQEVQNANTALEAGLITQQEFVALTEYYAAGYEKASEAIVTVTSETEKMAEQITFAAQAGEVFEQSFDRAFQGVAMGTQTVSDAVKNMSKVIIAELLKIAAYKTIAGFGFGGEFGGQVAWGAAQGGVVSGGNKVQAFASGGIVNGPTAFGMSRGRTGLMGEAGPEMIAPVKRMPNGDMGVGASPVNVTVNNNAAGVETVARQDSNGGLTIDVVLKQAAQAIQSGGNVFADSLEKSYSLNRGRSTY
jgi:hypothetical protein